MANGRDRQKLELTWIGKENRLKLEPRILLEDGDKSYRRPEFISGPNQKPISAESEMLKQVQRDIFDNRLIFGDNLLALKALEQEFAGKVKCIFIDPPYNTGSAFTHYDDGLEHSIWLSLMSITSAPGGIMPKSCLTRRTRMPLILWTWNSTRRKRPTTPTMKLSCPSPQITTSFFLVRLSGR